MSSTEAKPLSVFVFNSITHPDEEVNGPITDYMVVKADPNPVLDSVLRPDEQRAMVERMGGVCEYHVCECPRDKTSVRERGIFGTVRSADTVPPDLYEKWHRAFMEANAMRAIRIAEAGVALSEAQRNFDRAVRLYTHNN